MKHEEIQKSGDFVGTLAVVYFVSYTVVFLLLFGPFRAPIISNRLGVTVCSLDAHASEVLPKYSVRVRLQQQSARRRENVHSVRLKN